MVARDEISVESERHLSPILSAALRGKLSGFLSIVHVSSLFKNKQALKGIRCHSITINSVLIESKHHVNCV